MRNMIALYFPLLFYIKFQCDANNPHITRIFVSTTSLGSCTSDEREMLKGKYSFVLSFFRILYHLLHCFDFSQVFRDFLYLLRHNNKKEVLGKSSGYDNIYIHLSYLVLHAYLAFQVLIALLGHNYTFSICIHITYISLL